MTMTRNTHTRRNAVSPPANPYIGRSRDPGLARILEAAAQGAAVVAAPAGGEQDDGSDEGEDDDIRSGGDYDAPAGYIRGNLHPPLLGPINLSRHQPTPLGSALQPPPIDGTVATAPSDDSSPSGVYDGLAKLDPNTIVDKTFLAKVFRVSEKTIRRRVHAGELPPPYMRIGRQPQWIVGVLLDCLKDKAMRIVSQEEARRQHIRDKTE